MKQSLESARRTLVKTISYRIFIMILDFTFLYIFTHKIEIAIGFMIASNIYTTGGYYIHERIWNRIKWGINLKSVN